MSEWGFWGGLEIDVENSINVLKVIYEQKWKILIEITQLWLTQPLLWCIRVFGYMRVQRRGKDAKKMRETSGKPAAETENYPRE